MLIIADKFFSMLLTKNYNNAFKLVKVIIQIIVNPEESENGILDDVTITSALRNDKMTCGEGFLTF